MHPYRVRIGPALGLGLLDVTLVVSQRPDFAALAGDIHHPTPWVERVGADAAALSLAHAGLWLAGIWLAVGVVAALVSGLPGRIGAAAEATTRHVLPRFLRRVVIGSLGVGLVLVPAVAGAVPVAHSDSVSTPRIDWPTSARDAPAIDLPWPASPGSSRLPQPPVTQPPVTQPPVARTPVVREPATDGRLTVRTGDSLWLIAARRLGPSATTDQIAAAWPAWYETNSAVIGANPSVLHPGQTLAVPTTKDPTP